MFPVLVCFRPPVWFGIGISKHHFDKMSIFYIFDNYHYHYQGKGNRLVGSNILGVFVATELPCTFLDVKADRDCKPEIYLGNSPGYSFNLFN